MTTSNIAQENYFIGTNSQTRHIEEALRQGIVAPDEKLLGLFDGIFFDEQGKRVGGLALNDYLVITNRRVTLWARDQFKDYVDHFPLSHVFIEEQAHKDTIHGLLKLRLVMPDVEENEIGDGESIGITFDFVPLPDLPLLVNVLEVLSSLHRDMIGGGAGLDDRAKAAIIIFQQTFVIPISKGAKVKMPVPSPVSSAQNYANEEPLYTIEEAEENQLVTPLSRLDNLDTLGKQSSFPNFNAPPQPGTLPSNYRQPAPPRPASRPPTEGRWGPESRLLSPGEHYAPPPSQAGNQAYEQTNPAYSYSSGNLDEELRWLNGGQSNPPANYKPGSGGRAPMLPPNSVSKAPPGVRLKEDLNPEGFYTLGRAGRAAWDAIEKLRREAEAKGAGLIPGLNMLRDSGMSMKEMTDFLVAVNNLMDTLGRNPAAREIAMTFLNRTLGNTNPAAKIPVNNPLSKFRRKEGMPIMEEGEDDLDLDTPSANTTASEQRGKGVNLKVEKRNRGDQPTKEVKSATGMQKVAIRKHSTKTNDEDNANPDNQGEEPGLAQTERVVVPEPQINHGKGISLKVERRNSSNLEEMGAEEVATRRPVAIHRKLQIGAGAADSGGDDEELFDPHTTPLKLPISNPEFEELDEF